MRYVNKRDGFQPSLFESGTRRNGVPVTRGRISMTALRLAAVGLLVCPGFLLAQKREDFLSIQRDVAQLQDQVKQLQASQDQKMASLQALTQQAVEESSRMAAAVSALQKTVTDRLADQQAKIEA